MLKSDEEKLEKFREFLENPVYSNDYVPVFGFSNLTVHLVYPESVKGSSLNLYERVPDKWMGAYRNIIPLLVYDPLANTYFFGYMEATVYVQ